jgi:hypothetical protein
MLVLLPTAAQTGIVASSILKGRRLVFDIKCYDHRLIAVMIHT